MKVKSESEVAQSCLTLSDPMDCSLPGSSLRGIFQARVLEWGAIAFSKTVYCAFFIFWVKSAALEPDCVSILANHFLVLVTKSQFPSFRLIMCAQSIQSLQPHGL